MSDTLTLPLPVEELPQQLRRFCDPKAPGPARAMAAKGVVPVKGADPVFMLLQLAADSDEALASTAIQSLQKLPEPLLVTASQSATHPALLAGLIERFSAREDLRENVAANTATHAATLERIARSCSEQIAERIAVNEQRLLAAPRVIEALYKNRHTRMSTADRLVELAARNGVELSGIPAFKAHVEAIAGLLIAEPTDEPLPGDEHFHATLVEDERCSSDHDDVMEYHDEDGIETVMDAGKPLLMRIHDMTTPEKIRLSLIGNVAARAFLVRDRNRTVAHAAISSPSMTDSEAATIARSREVGEDILRYIGNKREWLRNHEVKRSLVFNPKTPVGISLRFVGHMRDPELRALARSRGVSQPVKAAAMQRLDAKQRRG